MSVYPLTLGDIYVGLPLKGLKIEQSKQPQFWTTVCSLQRNVTALGCQSLRLRDDEIPVAPFAVDFVVL